MKELERSQIDLWFADLENFDLCRIHKECVDWLDLKETERAHRYQSQCQREQFVLGRILLRLILSKYSNCSPSALNFHTDKHGKLFLCPHNQSSLFFNLSHSYNRLVIAVSKVQGLGVDIELMNENRAILKVAKRYFSPLEFQELCNLPRSLQTRRFYELWTLKESVLKAYGVGLSGHLSKIKFAFPAPNKLDMSFEPTKLSSSVWQSWQIQTLKPYVLALSIRSLDTRISHIESQTLMSLDKIVAEETQIIRSF